MKSAHCWSFEIWSLKRFRTSSTKWHQSQRQIQLQESQLHRWRPGKMPYKVLL